MMKITKEGDERYPDVRISDDDKSFLIKRKNAPDLFLIPDFHPINDNDDIKFIMNEDDGDIYTLFNILYKDIISGNVFLLNQNEIYDKSDEEIKRIKHEKAKQRKSFRKLAQATGLVKDGIITWHSEDLDPFELSATLTIKKLQSQIEIIFTKNKIEDDSFRIPTYAIRISESWSIYQSFFCPFVRLHRNLQAVDWSINNNNSLEISKKKKINDVTKPHNV